MENKIKNPITKNVGFYCQYIWAVNDPPIVIKMAMERSPEHKRKMIPFVKGMIMNCVMRLMPAP